MNRSVLVCCCLLFHLSSLQAQDFYEYVKDLRKGYSNIENLKLKMSVTAFQDSSRQDQVYDLDIIMVKRGEEYEMNYGAVELVMDKRQFLMVNHEQGFIQLKMSDQDFQEEYQKYVASLDMDSIFQNLGIPQLISKEGNMLHYRLQRGKNHLNIIDFIIDQKQGRIASLNYAFTTGELVFIKFVDFNLNPQYDLNFPNFNRFIIQSEDSIVLSPAYNNYQLIK